MSAIIDTFPPELRPIATIALKQSDYLIKQLTKSPEWQSHILEKKTYQTDTFQSEIDQQISQATTEQVLEKTIRIIRNKEMSRIAWRDLSNSADLIETMRDTSNLASFLVNACSQWWYEKLSNLHGNPTDENGNKINLTVLGLGKLGGLELNFSSDIDLIFAYPCQGETTGKKPIDHQMFFTRLGQKVISTLSKITGDGMAYRVDMRLRPFGKSGPLAISFDAMEHYYQTHGREWERYALIKARVIAGGESQGQALMQRLQPFIYRRYLDYGAVEHLSEMKAMIDQEAKRKGKVGDIKLGQGGIREVEFIAQVFQLMRGGRLPEIQSPSILHTLNQLNQLNILDDANTQALLEAYFFLRRVENRLQMAADQQTHTLPTEPEALENLAHSMQFANTNVFLETLNTHRHYVVTQFENIFSRPASSEETPDASLEKIWHQISDQNEEQTENQHLVSQHLSAFGYKDTVTTYTSLANLKGSRLYNSLTDTGRTRLDKLIPKLITECATQSDSDQALQRCIKVITKIASRSGYIIMLVDNDNALNLLVKLISKSRWIANLLATTPLLLDELLDARQLFQPLNREELQSALSDHMQNVDSNDTEEIMERLRHFKQAQVLRVAATDITGHMPLMKVSDQLTWIAEAILQTTLETIWTQFTQQYGMPCYSVDNQSYEAGLAIIGYGKLGGIELGYSSDLDIIFVHDSHGEQQLTNGDKSIDNTLFFSRFTQRCIHFLNTYTNSGRLYETDIRLRPGGASGLIVSNIESFKKYQLNKAWTWEHQALVRARGITGSTNILQQFETIRAETLQQPRDQALLRDEIVTMRKKMWDALSINDQNNMHLKKNPGGITDLEFVVQYLILLHANEKPEITHYSDNIRLLENLSKHNIIENDESDRLINTYQSLRDQIHSFSLQEKSPVIPKSELSEAINTIKQFWGKYLATTD